MRLFILVWAGVAAWCFHFISTHGMLYVRFPTFLPFILISRANNDSTGQLAKAEPQALRFRGLLRALQQGT
jgi:hypothetical protein